MRVLNWNLHYTNGIGTERQDAIVGAIQSLEPDILLLQEVPLKGSMRDRLAAAGFSLSDATQGAPGLWRLPYASFVASRLPMVQIEPPTGLRFPSLFAVARIAEIEFASVHIPNASGFNSAARQRGHERDVKVTHLERTLGWMRTTERRLVAGDFNEPTGFHQGLAVSFRSSRAIDRDRQRLVVDGLLNSDELTHLCGDLHDFDDEPSHWIRSTPHPPRKGWFDHAVASAAMDGWRAEYIHDLRSERDARGRERFSDHSPLLIVGT